MLVDTETNVYVYISVNWISRSLKNNLFVDKSNLIISGLTLSSGILLIHLRVRLMHLKFWSENQVLW